MRSLTEIWSDRSFEQGLRALLVLNVLDATFTLTWVLGGWTGEANPIMAAALQAGPQAFVLSKLALVSAAVTLLWRHRARIGSRVALVPVALLYSYVAGGHIGFLLKQLGLTGGPGPLASL
jgi:hypothetical protein